MVITEMDRAECIALVGSSSLARLACEKNGQPYVVPITYAVDGNHLYSFSLLGQKLLWMRENPKVCVQVDQFGEPPEWRSVVIFGRYEELPDVVGGKVRRERAWSLLSRRAQWWEPGGIKPVARAPAPHFFYRIVMDEISGRHARPDEQAGRFAGSSGSEASAGARSDRCPT